MTFCPVQYHPEPAPTARHSRAGQGFRQGGRQLPAPLVDRICFPLFSRYCRANNTSRHRPGWPPSPDRHSPSALFSVRVADLTGGIFHGGNQGSFRKGAGGDVIRSLSSEPLIRQCHPVQAPATPFPSSVHLHLQHFCSLPGKQASPARHHIHFPRALNRCPPSVSVASVISDS